MYRVNSFKYTKTKSKYKNQTQWYNGNYYHSKLECKVAQDLDVKKEAGLIKSWERQVKIEFNIKADNEYYEPVLTDTPKIDLKKWGAKFWHITNYFIDFKVYHNDGTIEFLEAKGLELPDWKIKWGLLEALYGSNENYKLTVVKK